MGVRVALMVTCLVDLFFPDVATAMVRLLRRQGVHVDFPEAQVCCGQIAFNGGYRSEAAAAGRRLLDAFDTADYVVAPSGSCAAMVRRHLPELLVSDPVVHRRAVALGERTYEFSQFMVHVLGAVDVGARWAGRATYHPGCHATRELGVRDEPRQLLAAVRDLELVELPGAADCCGFGGTFAVKMASISEAMAASKAASVVATGADLLVGSDMGCLMQIGGLLSRDGRPVRTLHLAELLAEGVGIR